METVIDNKFTLIKFDKDKELLIVVSKPGTQEMHLDAMKKEVLIVCDAVTELKPKFYLQDDRERQNIFTVDEQAWVAETITMAVIGVGLKKFVLINSKELIVEMATEQTVDEVGKVPHEIAIFSDEREAMDWLFS